MKYLHSGGMHRLLPERSLVPYSVMISFMVYSLFLTASSQSFAQQTIADTYINSYTAGNTRDSWSGGGWSVGAISRAYGYSAITGNVLYRARAQSSLGLLSAFVDSEGIDSPSSFVRAASQFSDLVKVSTTTDLIFSYDLAGLVQGHNSSTSTPTNVNFTVSGHIYAEDENTHAIMDWDPVLPSSTSVDFHATNFLHVNAGDTISFWSSLVLKSQINNSDSPSDIIADFTNGARIYLDSSTPGDPLVGATGHDYSSPPAIPEPAFYQMSAFVTLGGLSMYRKFKYSRRRIFN